MVANFVAGGAAINVLARRAGARLLVVDAGVATPVSGVRSLRLGPGTANIAAGPAMTRGDRGRGCPRGRGDRRGARSRADRHRRDGHRQHDRCLRTLRGAPRQRTPEAVTGEGTGLDDDGRAAQGRRRPAGAGRQPPTASRSAVLAASAGSRSRCSRASCSAAPRSGCRWCSTASSPALRLSQPPGWRRRRRAR